jgi:ribosomal protein L32
VEPVWEIGAGEVRARCPSCGQTSTAAVEEKAAAPPPPTKVRFSTPAPELPPVRVCPKCGNSPVNGAACTRCGLAVERMDGWSEDTQVPDEIAAAWAACLAAWTDSGLHDRVASLSLTHSSQPWLARRYRAILRERPDDAIAAARLERVGRIAQAAVLASGAAPRASRFSRGSSAVILVVLALAVVGGLLFTLYLKRKAEAPPPAPAIMPGKRAPAVPIEPWQRTELRDPPPPRPRVESSPPP